MMQTPSAVCYTVARKLYIDTVGEGQNASIRWTCAYRIPQLLGTNYKTVTPETSSDNA
jgi:hypothetical protein